jgi:hypothetical protein
MAVVPAANPATVPDAGLIVATAVLPLVQVPPVVASLSVTLLPTHSAKGPVMAASG